MWPKLKVKPTWKDTYSWTILITLLETLVVLVFCESLLIPSTCVSWQRHSLMRESEPYCNYDSEIYYPKTHILRDSIPDSDSQERNCNLVVELILALVLLPLRPASLRSSGIYYYCFTLIFHCMYCRLQHVYSRIHTVKTYLDISINFYCYSFLRWEKQIWV